MSENDTAQDQGNLCKVIKVVPENQDTTSLYIEGFDEKLARRKPGQFITIRIMKPDGWSEPHPFTVASPPEDPTIRLTIKKEGNFTSAIPDLKPGTQVRCMGPLGQFCRDIDTNPVIVMIAGGVGVTPFLCVLRHFRYVRAGNSLTLFWVNKTIDDVFDYNEIKEMTRELKLDIVHCLSREDNVERHFQKQYPHVLYEKGRLNGDILMRHGITRSASFYLCGPPPMMETAIKELEAIGVNPVAIQSEKFTR